MGRKLLLPSGRVIALGRLLLAVLFLCAMGLERSTADEMLPRIIELTLVYLLFAAAMLVACWNDWWREARTAGPAHAIDIAMFTLLVLLTEGYWTPYFSFFMFLLLSSAIRWGWRATALTTALLSILYLGAGPATFGGAKPIDPEHLVVGAGNLLILSLILIWFGIQWRPRFSARDQDLLDRTKAAESLEAGLGAAIRAMRAGAGAFAWRKPDRDHFQAVTMPETGMTKVSLGEPQTEARRGTGPFLYDLPNDRCLWRDGKRSLRAAKAHDLISAQTASELSLVEGLAVPVRSGAGEGVLFLEKVRALSTDHLDLGRQLGAELGAVMEQRALLRAAEEGAAARTRLGLARDLHDSVVQFLAGAAFRLEAVRRAEAAGAQVGPQVDELKKLMLEEQGELRSFMAVLRSGSRVALEDLAKDLDTLVVRLSKQWSIECDFSSESGSASIPTRIHLDAQQLVREAVANAVRHAGAKSVKVRLATANDELRLDFINDGSPYPRSTNGERMPRSMTERVQEAGGALELSRGMGLTKLSIALPIGARA